MNYITRSMPTLPILAAMLVRAARGDWQVTVNVARGGESLGSKDLTITAQ